ncbi:MAG: hypothetical protein HQ562_01075 [Candidatus Marinimicrobia bacterium]|nr:hypothetical protein [Candidatus Neomarinimicrobiota bacterium]
MSDKSPFVPTFISELKRRKVFRVAGVYAIVAWLIIQIGETTFDALNLPSWALTFIIILLFTGFPIAIIFAWIFDKTPEGKIQLEKQDQNLRSVIKKKRTWFALGGITVGLIVGVIFARVYYPATLDNVGINDKSVAVLPFTPFTISEENQSFADGVHDDILNQLSKIKDIKVISRTSVMEYKNTTKKIRTIAQELNVQHVLEGSVRRAGNQIRIVAQLINVNTDNHIWSETYDREYADIFAIQSDVAKKIAAALKATLTPEEIDYIDEIPTDNLEAYDYFLKGKHFWNTYMNKAGNQRAVDMFTKAIELDPDFALAYTWASITHSALYSRVYWDHSQERKDLAKSTLEQAITLDPDHPRVHLAKGAYQYACLYDLKSALRELKIALKGEPNNYELTRLVGFLNLRLGNLEQGEEALLKAVELDPLNSFAAWDLGDFHRRQRQFQKADYYYKLGVQTDPEQANNYSSMAFNYLHGFGDIEKAQSLLKEAELNVKDPEGLLIAQYWTEKYARDYSKALSYAKDYKEFYSGSLLLGEAYHFLGKEELAQAELESMRIYYEEKVVKEPEHPTFHSMLGIVYAYLGLKEKAIVEGQKAVELLPIAKNHLDGPYCIYDLVIIYILTGEYELAIDNIEYLLSIPSSMTKWELRLDPIYDPLRENPRFQKLIDSVSS